LLKSLSQSHRSQLLTVETQFHGTSNGEYFATTQITLVMLIAVLPQSAVSSGIDPLIEQIYGILCGCLLSNIQRIRNTSKMEAKEGLTECTGVFDECISYDTGTSASWSTSST
jgi:hypothetical protein